MNRKLPEPFAHWIFCPALDPERSRGRSAPWPLSPQHTRGPPPTPFLTESACDHGRF